MMNSYLRLNVIKHFTLCIDQHCHVQEYLKKRIVVSKKGNQDDEALID